MGHKLLHKLILRDQIPEVILRHVVVVNAVLLARARTARRVRDGQRVRIRVFLKEHVEQRALADPAGAGDDNRAAIGGRSHGGW